MPVPSRRRAARALAVTVVTLGLTPALQGHAWACSCVPPQVSVEEEYRAAAREAAFIYLGRVTHVERDGDEMNGVDRYTVAVEETLKGRHRDSQELTSAANGGLCGVRLTVDKDILVVDDGRGVLSSCDRLTTQDGVAKYAAILRAALGPSMPRTGADTPAAWVVLAAGGLLIARRLRREPA